NIRYVSGSHPPFETISQKTPFRPGTTRKVLPMQVTCRVSAAPPSILFSINGDSMMFPQNVNQPCHRSCGRGGHRPPEPWSGGTHVSFRCTSNALDDEVERPS